jgi:hypothetical protein
MSGRLALSSETTPARLLILDGDTVHEVFDVLATTDALIRARSALQFEVGEELQVRIEQDGSVWGATARVLGHVGKPGDRVTELEISDRRPVRPAAG